MKCLQTWKNHSIAKAIIGIHFFSLIASTVLMHRYFVAGKIYPASVVTLICIYNTDILCPVLATGADSLYTAAPGRNWTRITHPCQISEAVVPDDSLSFLCFSYIMHPARPGEILLLEISRDADVQLLPAQGSFSCPL